MPVDFAVASYASTFLPGARERTWGVLVAPPSTGKSEILRVFRDYDPRHEPPQRTVEVDDLTENALASAWRDEENPDEDKSVLAKLDARRYPYGPKVLVWTDMTTALTMPRERRSRIFGQLRRAYDGDYNNHAGQLGHVYYELGFGFVGACTEAIDDARKQDQALGERIVLCRINRGNASFASRKAVTTSALTSDPYRKESLRAYIRKQVMSEIGKLIERVTTTKDFAIKRPPELLDRVADLGTIMTAIRTVPVSSHTFSSAPEAGARIALQLETWADARAAFEGRDTWDETDLSLIRRIVQDTLPPDFLRAVRVMWGKDGDGADKSWGAEEVRYRAKCEEAMYRQMRQWALVGFLWETTDGAYSISPDFAEAFRRSDFLGGLDDVPTVG